MTRIKHNYPATSEATLKAIIACHNEAIRLFHSGEGDDDGGLDNSQAYPIKLLLGVLPQGPLSAARLDKRTGLIAFNVKDRNERYVEPEAFLLMRTLMLFEPGSLHIDSNSPDGRPGCDYVEVFGDLGITLHRLLVDAQRGEKVRSIGDHHFLNAANLEIIRGPKAAGRGRKDALEWALKSYDKNAHSWGLDGLISRHDYRLMIRNAFRMYDIRHSNHHLRAVGA